MTVLKNARRERFAQEIVKGKTITDAYVIAGYKSHDGNASKMYAKVRKRVEEITSRAAVNVGITKERVLAELGLLGFSNMEDYVTIGADGLPFVDMSKVDRNKMAAVQEVNVETIMRSEVNEAGEREAVPVQKVRFKLADKRAALVDIGKHLGMFMESPDRLEISGPGGGPIVNAIEVSFIVPRAKLNGGNGHVIEHED
jgi:phage terminase small subunit